MALKSLNEFVKQFGESLPPSLRHLKDECEEHFHRGLILALKKLDLVTREEFETQTKVLSKTSIQLKKLEEKIAALEKRHHK